MDMIHSYESLEDALMFCIRSSGKEVKQVAAALWPSDRIETAYPRLVAAISSNDSKRTKLSLNEIIFIMNFCGRYDPLYYITDRCLHERPNKRSVEAEQKHVAEQFQQMIAQATKAYQHIIKLTKERDDIESIRNGVVSILDIEKKIG